MAGLWNRIIPAGESGDRLSVHLVKAAMYLYVRGVFTAPTLLAGLNSKLQTPLDASAQADLSAISAKALQPAATVDKLAYLEMLDALNIGVEMGVMTNETTWRTQLGI